MEIKLYKGDCNKLINQVVTDKSIIVTDPPFNIKYHYNKYKDNMKESKYFEMLKNIFSLCSSVVILYPEQMHKLSICLGKAPNKVVSWVYNSNTGKQHRDIGFYVDGGGKSRFQQSKTTI